MLDVFSAVEPQARIVVGLYGAGGFAREVMPILRAQVAQGGEFWADCQLVFVETSPTQSEVNGIQVLSEEAFFRLDCEQRYFNVAIGDSRVRERIATRCQVQGALPTGIRAADFVAYDGNDISEGAIFCARSMVTSNARIGRFFHANLFSYVAHDCVIGDFVTFAPNVHCNGNVHIHDHAYIGTGAVIKQGRPEQPLIIGEGAVVGMGAVVTRDVAPYTTVVGNPARPLNKGAPA